MSTAAYIILLGRVAVLPLWGGLHKHAPFSRDNAGRCTSTHISAKKPHLHGVLAAP